MNLPIEYVHTKAEIWWFPLVERKRHSCFISFRDFKFFTVYMRWKEGLL